MGNTNFLGAIAGFMKGRADSQNQKHERERQTVADQRAKEQFDLTKQHLQLNLQQSKQEQESAAAQAEKQSVWEKAFFGELYPGMSPVSTPDISTVNQGTPQGVQIFDSRSSGGGVANTIATGQLSPPTSGIIDFSKLTPEKIATLQIMASNAGIKGVPDLMSGYNASRADKQFQYSQQDDSIKNRIAMGNLRARQQQAKLASDKAVLEGQFVEHLNPTTNNMELTRVPSYPGLQGISVGGGGGGGRIAQTPAGNQSGQQQIQPEVARNPSQFMSFTKSLSEQNKPLSTSDRALMVHPDTLEIVPQGYSDKQASEKGYVPIAAAQKAKVGAFKSVEDNIGRIEALMSGTYGVADPQKAMDAAVFPESGGWWERTTGAPSRVLSETFQTNKQAAVLQSFLALNKVPLARAIGEVGNLSEAEQKGVENALPKMTDSADVAWLKVKILKDFMRGTRAGFFGAPGSSSYSQVRSLVTNFNVKNARDYYSNQNTGKADYTYNPATGQLE